MPLSLKLYNQKRDFTKTPEPKGIIKKTGKRRFVIQEHWAKKAGHHFDFRLEMQGVLRSWATHKEIPKKPGKRIILFEVEPHPVDYLNFEGEIKQGYGAGIVKIFDKGTYNLIKQTPKELIIYLKGKKIKGLYVILKYKEPNQFLFFKTNMISEKILKYLFKCLFSNKPAHLAGRILRPRKIKGLRYFRIGKYILIEQNPKSKSIYAKMAQKGKKIAWLIDTEKNKYIAYVTPNKVKFL